MKKVFFLMTLIYLSINVNAQNYLSIPDSNVLWIMEEYSGGPQPNWYFAYGTDSVSSDTIIGGKIYTQLFSNTPQQQIPLNYFTCYLGAYRSDTLGKVYYVPKDSLLEYRLYDFSKNTGDTINNVPLINVQCNNFISFSNISVDSVRYTTVGTRTFKEIFLNNGEIWMEGIGSPVGGFFPIGNGFKGIVCMSHADTIYYHCPNWQNCYQTYFGYDYSQGICDTIFTTSVQNISPEDATTIYPNPAGDVMVLMSSGTEESTMSIINMIGEEVYKAGIRNEKSEIDVSNFSPGVYFITLTRKSHVTVRKKFVKM